MSDFGIPLLIIAMLAILIVDVFSVSYLKTALIDLRMRKPGFFLGSVGICAMSIVLSLIMAGAFLQSPAKAENTEIAGTPEAGVVETPQETEATKEETEEEQQEPEQKQPEVIQVAETVAQAPATVQTQTTTVQTPTVQTKSSIQPSFEVWRGFYKGFSYNFIEITNGTPYVYMPSMRSDFQTDLNNIRNNREGGNIIVMANASVYNTTTTDPLGTTIQNRKIVTQNEGDSYWTLVVDDAGNVGYVKGAVKGTTTDYTDAKTGETKKNRNIVSAAYAFAPIVLNGKATDYYKTDAYRARQIFCVKQNSYVIITNTGEGDNGGWNTDDMVQVANYRGCLSAFNLDGGGSAATAYRTSLSKNFTIYATTQRHDPTFIVFTADNLVPRGK